MMKWTRAILETEKDEYLIVPENPDARDFKVLYKDNDITSKTRALVILGRLE